MSARIRRQRTRGWRMPEGAVYVGRPSPWGNPFSLDCWGAVALGYRGDVPGRRAASVALYRWWLTGTWTPSSDEVPSAGELEFADGSTIALETHVRMLAAAVAEGYTIPETRPDLEPLRGHALACWCPIGQPCHGDVLLDLLG